jgi:hypothetical protein
LASPSAHAINAKHAQQLERSGCTQVTEAQGCDITKTKAENAQAGFDSVPDDRGPDRGTYSGSPRDRMCLRYTSSLQCADGKDLRNLRHIDSSRSSHPWSLQGASHDLQRFELVDSTVCH